MANPFSVPPIEGGGGSGGSGDVSGPASSTDNAIARYDGTGGKTLQDSAATMADTTGWITFPAAGGITVGTANNAVAFGGVAAGNVALGTPSAGAATELAAFLGDGSNYANFIGATIQIGSHVGPKINTGAVADVILSNDAISAPATFVCAREVEANTAGSGAPNVLTAFESFKILTNEGAAAANYHTLPTAVAGYEFEFIVQDVDGLRVVAASGDTIRVIDKVTAAAGYIESTTIGSVVRLVAINATEWVATSIHGTWTDGTFTYDDTGNTTP